MQALCVPQAGGPSLPGAANSLCVFALPDQRNMVHPAYRQDTQLPEVVT